MYLKHLDVVGFKSFADSIKLDFEPGITSVIGPNGCGKSNIIDAVRWCLGEMSAKSLRSNLMMDVVFNGSGSRPQQNMAEVTLTFDNADRRLPIDFSEVSITRRLFRSGESEYFINKTQCRLRDIKELFLDTGMGEDGYSSMEQGKVEWILQAKPEERRELFEEAAGVSKYRARREEALRKLERLDIDLSRLADIITVTNDQIKKLESAVSKAKTYQRIREELKTMEIGDWLFQLQNNDADLKTVQDRLAEAQNRAEEWNTAAHQIDANLSELRLALAQNEEELRTANGILSTIDADVKVGEERLGSARQRQDDLKKQLAALNETFQREQERIGQLTEQETAQSAAVEQVKTDGASIETDFEQAQSTADEAQKNLESKKKEVKEARDLILDRVQERTRLQQQVGHFSSDVTRLESQAANLQKDRERARENLQEAERTRHLAEAERDGFRHQTGEQSSALGAMTQRSAELAGEESKSRARLWTLTEELARLSGQIQSIQDEQTRDPYQAGTQAVLSAGLSNIQGPLGRLIQSSDADRDLVAATLGEHLSDLVAESAADAEQAIAFLRDNEKGRVRIWILDKIQVTNSSETIGQVPGRNQLIDRIQCDSRYTPLLSLLCSQLWIQGSTVYGGAVVNGGADPSLWKSHIQHRLPELEKEAAQKQETKKALEEEIAQLGQAKSAAEKERENAFKSVEEFRIRLELAEKESDKLASKMALAQEEQQVIEIEIAQVQDDKVKARYALEECQNRFNLLQSQEQDDHAQLDLLQQELTEFQLLHANVSAELASRTEKHDAFQEKLEWQNSILEHTRGERAALNASVARHEITVASVNEGLANAKSTEAEAKNLIEDSLGKRQQASEKCEGLQARRVETAEKIQAMEGELSEARESLTASQDVVQAERINEAAMKTRSESLAQKLQDQYELSMEQAKELVPVHQADAETLEKLKKRVQNIGPVNLAAPQEHAELSEKFNFLVTQQNDLLKAKDDLRQVITKINATTREHFRETFQKVRENFRQLYGHLFQGGEADLTFTDEADILSTGIDIFCQPPGKKLLHISLLSGGEKALTAIALLFAFFQVRPSPVALLDEVDAPLDEANVLRYVEMVKRFSEKSQFLVITHNKRTMEAANTLYGVTMEELGVSKVLSARLSKEKAKEAPVAKQPATA